MKLSTVLFASTAVVFAVAACAAPSEQEEVDQSSSALCPKGQNCTPPKTSTSWWGGIDKNQLVAVDETPTTNTTTIQCGVPEGGTFTCEGPAVSCNGAVYKTDPSVPCGMVVRCTTQGCDCVPSCGGGSWGFGSFNPCLAGHTYTCNSLGQCRCN